MSGNFDYEDDLEYEDTLKYEANLKYEDDLKYQDNFEYEETSNRKMIILRLPLKGQTKPKLPNKTYQTKPY